MALQQSSLAVTAFKDATARERIMEFQGRMIKVAYMPPGEVVPGWSLYPSLLPGGAQAMSAAGGVPGNITWQGQALIAIFRAQTTSSMAPVVIYYGSRTTVVPVTPVVSPPPMPTAPDDDVLSRWMTARASGMTESTGAKFPKWIAPVAVVGVLFAGFYFFTRKPKR